MNLPDNNPNNITDTNGKGNFLKAMIKIAHPDWTQNQIEAEFIKQMTANNNNEEHGCEACSG